MSDRKIRIDQVHLTELIRNPEMFNATSGGFGSTNKEDRADYTDESEPIREQVNI